MQVASATSDTPAHSRDSDFDRLFRLSLDLLCIASLEGYFKRVNPSWTRVLGWSEEELLSRPVQEFMHPEDRDRTMQARDALARGVPLRNFENRYRCRDGSYRWLSWQSIAEPGERLVFAVARDITERRQLDHERMIMGRLESAGVLAAGMAHDFNNLLAGVLLNVELIGLCGPLSPQQAQFVQQAKQSILTAKTLTQQLLAITGPDTAARQIQPVGGLVAQAVEACLRDSGLHVHCTLDPDLRPARVNATQLTQVLHGLLLNAREATARGGQVHIVAANTALHERLPSELEAGEHVRITITDSGMGIAPEVMPRIFDPYFSTKDRSSQKGMGLSLTLCRVLLKRHGGALTVESQPGRGTTVACYLPATLRDPMP